MKEHSKASASTETLEVSWLNTSKSISKISLKDIRNHAGDGLVKLFFLLEKSDIKAVSQILAKYRRNVTLLPLEEFPVVDSKNRLQLKNKSQFLTSDLGWGSFHKSLSEGGHLKRMRQEGVEYLYLQPLNNVHSKIMDFDMLDIIISLNQVAEGNAFFPKKIEESFSYIPRDSQALFAQSRRTSSKISKIYSKDPLSTFNSQSNIDLKNRSYNHAKTLNHFPTTKLISSKNKDPELKLDCISKMFDLEGELALKVHDSPSDCLSSIKFFDLNTGLNKNKLHCGEAVFALKALESKHFAKHYNYCTPVLFNLSTRIAELPDQEHYIRP